METLNRRSQGKREKRDWRSELRRQQAASKGSYSMGGLPRTYADKHAMPSMPVFNLPPVEDEK